LEKLVEEGFSPQGDSGESVRGAAEAREAAELLERLEEPYREAVQMRYIDELSPKEIAEALEVSENVVSVRVNRGIAKLRALIEPSQS
jgi:RNA polymerase sigma factor (sigma-70 family)